VKDPRFLTVAHIIELQGWLIERYGGTTGLRDPGLLESAVAMPSIGFGDQYVHADLYAMAAAYLFHLVKNHAFVDGNKRIGTVAALEFLDLNGIWVEMDQDILERFVWDVAAGKHGKDAIAEFFREHTSESKP
jgi:death-on-curing protein